jgi:hypothetical protein
MQLLTVFAIIFRASSDRCSNYQHALGILLDRKMPKKLSQFYSILVSGWRSAATRTCSGELRPVY